MTCCGVDPARVSTCASLKYPSARIRSAEARISRGLKGSPSTVRNWRRITSSSVVVLPSMSMRSTKMRGPRTSASVRSSVWLRMLRVTRGSTLTKFCPCCRASVSIRWMVFSTAEGL